jgi:Xaa-Pro aminopeptidase
VQPLAPRPLPATFHAANRRNLAQSIGADAIAIIDTADVLSRPGDYEYPYRADSNFFYLTGIAEPEAVLILVPGQASARGRELLFTSGTSEFVGTWEGDRLTPEEAAKRSGIQAVLPLDQLDHYLERILGRYRQVYLNAPEALSDVMPSPAKRRANHLHDTMPLHELRSALPLLAHQRMVKTTEELDQIRQAISITSAGLAQVWRTMRPGQHEYDLEAELTASFLHHGGAKHGFLPIIAAGPATTVIHYTKNTSRLAATDLVLCDIGAEHSLYSADISRTVPVAGRFTPRQRAVYEAVHRVQQAAMSLLKPGVHLPDYEEAVCDLVLQELVGLGLVTPAEAKSPRADALLRTFYPHAASHHLGLDVHDVADYRQPLAAGMVVTVEPGIYIREEGIGVRLEDDILITETGHENLSAAIPSTADAIEQTLSKAQN